MAIGSRWHSRHTNKREYGAIGYYRRLRQATRAVGAHYLYETTARALLIIQTLRDLVQTGDEVIEIEGICRARCPISSIASTERNRSPRSLRRPATSATPSPIRVTISPALTSRARWSFSPANGNGHSSATST